jgi:ATP-binding protein involved in chromosome partitioning
MLSKEELLKWLEVYQDPILGLSCKKNLKSLELSEAKARLAFELGYPSKVFADHLAEQLKHAFPDIEFTFQINTKIQAHAVQPSVKAVPGIKNIIAVASGKGGVGKSTTSVNLALALQKEGARVGLLDADIYGPNQPQMLGVNIKPEITMEKKFIPVEAHGLQTMSIGYLIDASQATIWRGPMVSGALTQLINDTVWDDLDYLIVDLPPGTGDIQLTLSQKIPVSGAVIVTTPQDVAVADARKALAMFKKVSVPVLGLVENMSYFECAHCDDKTYIFGQGGAEKLATEFNVPLLGEMPLLPKVREQLDQGKPPVVSDPESNAAKLYQTIALKVAAQLSLRPRNYASKFPKIIIEE